MQRQCVALLPLHKEKQRLNEEVAEYLGQKLLFVFLFDAGSFLLLSMRFVV